MVQSDATAARRDAGDAEPTESTSGFLRSVEFLTGPDPNLGSFLLVVGIVSVVFVALFQFTLPAPVSNVLTAGVLAVTVGSALAGALLDRLGYFEATARADDPEPEARVERPWVVAEGAVPLPPLLNFDADLRAYADEFGGTLPEAFDPFVRDYRRLKTNTRNRATIASDLRADLNPIGALVEPGSAGDRRYEEMSDRLFRYVGGDDLVALDRLTFRDEAGAETDAAAIAGGLGRVAVAVDNEGEAAAVTVVVDLYDDAGTVVASRTCDLGVVAAGGSAAREVDLFVPAEVVRADATVRARATTAA